VRLTGSKIAYKRVSVVFFMRNGLKKALNGSEKSPENS